MPELRIIGVGMGPHQVTPEAAAALRGCDYLLAVSKRDDDPLLHIRRALCDSFGVELVVLPDPARDRDDPVDYPGAVHDWHAARLAAFSDVLQARPGVVGFAVWGDPSLYDSTIRIASGLATDLGWDWAVWPGISAPALLAARHKMVLHTVGQPVHVTTARRLRSDLDTGQRNLVVMLGSGMEPVRDAGIDDWQIWWGANLGTEHETLLAGTVAGVLDEITEARDRVKQDAGWVMDVYALRGP